MPRGDKTGPMETGMVSTGREYGLRSRVGRAHRHGCRRMDNETVTPRWVCSREYANQVKEGDFLAQEADFLESRLKQVRIKMAETDAGSAEMKEKAQNPVIEKQG